MAWSFPIARVAGTTIRIHLTFLLLLAWLGMAWFLARGATAAASELGFLLLLFLCVILHEFGHIVMARRFGVRTHEIVLLPMGGVSRLDAIPEKPKEEIAIALAGPAVSLALGAAFMIAGGGLPTEAELAKQPLHLPFLVQLGLTNIALGLFNLIPAFPMDGGRVLRAAIATHRGHADATRIAAAAGQVFAFLFGLLGLLAGNPLLVLIALFVYVAAGAEAGLAQMRRAVWGASAADVMMTRFATLPADTTVEEAAEAMLRTGQHDFPIVDESGSVAGMLGRNDIVRAMRESGAATPVRRAMRTDITFIAANQPAEACVRLIQDGTTAALVRDSGGKVIGLVTWDNLVQTLLFASASARGRSGRPLAIASRRNLGLAGLGFAGRELRPGRKSAIGRHEFSWAAGGAMFMPFAGTVADDRSRVRPLAIA